MGRRDIKTICQTCRSRKVKCDGNLPACHRCVISGRECSYARKREILFRHSKLASVPGGESDGSSAGVLVEAKAHEPPARDAGRRSSPEAVLHGTPYSPYHSTRSGGRSHGYDVGPRPNTVSSGDLGSSPSPAAPPTPQTVQFEPAAAPRKLTALEGELLHFYVCNIGPWLDVTSPERHYTYTVPRLALRSPVLFFAIMACSAHILRLLSRSRHDDLAGQEESYQHRCVSLLIPVLDDDLATAVRDEVVLATIVILRMSEQYDEYHDDRQFHLVPQAFSHFVAAGPSSTALGGLREATFYSYVRSDIRMAILGRCPTRMQLDSWPLDTSSPVSDADWANRATWLTVQAINLCYGVGGPGVLPRDDIVRLVDEWRDRAPDTFEPYYYDDSPTRPFPVIRLLCPWHAVGLQFYHTCKILLATQGLHHGTFSDMLHINRHVASEILPHARRLCAISFSNEHYGCRINASHQLAMGAQFFNGKNEQREVLDYFRLLQEENAWPSRACREMLANAYGEIAE